MDYDHSYPNTMIRCHSSDIQLYIDSDAAYLIFLKTHSQGAGYFYINDKIDNTYYILGNRWSNGLRKTPFVAKHENLAVDVGLRLGFATLIPYVSPCEALHRRPLL